MRATLRESGENETEQLSCNSYNNELKLGTVALFSHFPLMHYYKEILIVAALRLGGELCFWLNVNKVNLSCDKSIDRQQSFREYL